MHLQKVAGVQFKQTKTSVFHECVRAREVWNITPLCTLARKLLYSIQSDETLPNFAEKLGHHSWSLKDLEEKKRGAV